MAKQLFTLNGHYKKREASLTWEDGEISGDESAKRALINLANDQRVVWFGNLAITKPGDDHLKNPLAASVLMHDVLYPIRDWTGQLPEVPSVPDGAIA